MASDDTPSLITPVDAVSVDGDEVVYVWSSTEAADAYRLQVAETAGFDSLVVDAEVGDKTAVTVGNQLPTDGRTFFWRVLVKMEGEWSAPSSVESFVATTAADAEQGPPDASDEEPVTELARAARREATATETFDLEDQVEKEKERGVAYEGVAATQIMGVSASIITVVLVAIAILFGWFGQVTQSEERASAKRMQYRDIKQAEMEAAQQLQQYGVVDEEAGTYRIPIDRAMDLVATEEYRKRQPSE
ncbi:hypothetical protein [Salinibacter altiplanensis]|uniref:hypothetical protein n=1 Tax=Salinibacter altiplanensis TaxID=1803181 RepID=UPI000C9FA762|nr:hypothetical protein [Salinibacter altiplanensis]